MVRKFLLAGALLVGLTNAAVADDVPPYLGMWSCHTRMDDGTMMFTALVIEQGGALQWRWTFGNNTFDGSGNWSVQDTALIFNASGEICAGSQCRNGALKPTRLIWQVTGPGRMTFTDLDCVQGLEQFAQDTAQPPQDGESDAVKFLRGLGQVLNAVAQAMPQQPDQDDADQGSPAQGYGGDGNYADGGGYGQQQLAPPSQPYVDTTAQKARQIASLRYMLSIYKNGLRGAQNALKLNENSPYRTHWVLQVSRYERLINETESKIRALGG